MELLESYFHTPGQLSESLFYTVARAGRTYARAGSVPVREKFFDHALVYCNKGTGTVEVKNRQFQVHAGEVVWLDTSLAYSHGPARNTQGWEISWARIEGPHLAKLSALLDVNHRPVFAGLNAESVSNVFARILRLMVDRPLAMDALINAAIAEVIAALFANRTDKFSQFGHPDIPERLRQAIAQMRAHYQKPWQVSELAGLCQLSDSQFYRLFRQALGCSPIQWLRRERINRGKQKLVETNAKINAIAEQCGYSDPLYFSRDFTRVVGVSPRAFRRIEKAQVTPADSRR